MNNTNVRGPGKLSKINVKVLFFSNPGDNIWLLVKVRDRLVPMFYTLWDLVSWIGEQWEFQMYFWQIFQAPWHNCCYWKSVWTLLQFKHLLQLRGICGYARPLLLSWLWPWMFALYPLLEAVSKYKKKTILIHKFSTNKYTK